ncbi:hypothetical protein [Saccharothrix lopnurensis]|uniref:Phage tail protein n=1 Tax=Saccharothrix lopnurensis TaxID=1670621 RepID=A0ABW1PI84_9PSEU
MAAGDLLTADGQVEWRGVVLGSDAVLGTTSIEGWKDRAARGGNRDLSGFHGALPARWLAEQRQVVWSFVNTVKGAALAAAIEELEALTQFDEQPVEEELCIRLDGVRAMVHATLVGVALPVGLDYSQAQYVTGAVRWVASSPRKLLLPGKSEPIGLPTEAAGDGLEWPLEWPLDWGTGVTGGQVTVTNAGPAAAWPLLRVTGPAPALRITNLDTGQRLTFDPAWTLPAGQTIEIDTRPGYRTVLFTPSGVSADARLFVRDWFPIPARSSIRIGVDAAAYDPAARLTVLWHDTTQ